MYTITKRYEFEAAHSLPQLPDGHKCKNPHGHSYVVEIRLKTKRLDAYGFVLDFAKLDEVMNPIIARLDHHDVNEVVDGVSTSENIARWVYELASAELSTRFGIVPERVRVSETRKTWAEYKP